MKKTEAYRTPDNDSDSATTENTKTITKMARLQQLKINYQKLFLKEGKKLTTLSGKMFIYRACIYKITNNLSHTPRLKLMAYEIHGICSTELTYVDKLADYNEDIKYLMVAVDCVSRLFT